VLTKSTSAKLEAQENDLPATVPFRIQGFPTLKFKPAGTRDFIDYDGDRSLESLLTFVQENAKNKVEPKAAPTSSESVAATEASATPTGHDEL
jgi:protein disulfide-isomerase A1